MLPDTRARVVTMFYAQCPMACPLTIETLRRLDAALTKSERTQLEILPFRSTLSAALPRLWTLARASVGDTRKLAALLDIPYRALQDGEFSHASVLVHQDQVVSAIAPRSDRESRRR